MSGTARSRLVATLGIATGALVLLVTVLVLASASEVEDLAVAGHIPLAWTALAILMAVFLLGLFTRSARVDLGRRFPWVVGGLSLVVSLGTWALLALGNESLAASVYRGLRVPQGIVQFWDISLVMLSVDCARWGFDIYKDNNGCMQDASIYAPGMVWLRFVPFGLFSQDTVPGLGVGLMLAASVTLVWLARQSSGLGQVTLAIAAVGAPWVLLLERANIDAVVFVILVVGVIITRRRPSSLPVWFIAAALFWLMGTWKYYPFVMGIALLPVLRLRRGWTVVAAYAAATIAYVLITWQNLLFSSASNSSMVDFGDWAVLGRVPLVARMIGAVPGAEGIQGMDIPVVLLVFVAFVWGVAAGRFVPRRFVFIGALASGGAALYLSSVFVAGFGYGYKAAFLLAGVPLVSSVLTRASKRGQRAIVGSSLVVLVLIAVQSAIMWNTVLVTQAGLVAASFLLGAGLQVIAVYVRGTRSREALKA